MNKQFIKWLCIFSFVCYSLGLAGSVFAASPVGLWQLSYFTEPGLTGGGGTSNICFKANGTFSVMTVDTPWVGVWLQKGDRLRFVGTITIISGNRRISTGNFGQFINNNSFSGEFLYFNETFPQPAFVGNYFARKVASLCF